MSTVAYHDICDRCQKPSPEYSSWNICMDCGDDLCEECSGVKLNEYSYRITCSKCAPVITVLDTEPKPQDTAQRPTEAKAKLKSEGRTGTANVPTVTKSNSCAPVPMQEKEPTK